MNNRRPIRPSVIIRWLILTLAGWLGYALVRGVWAIVYLGAPLYDWTWYIPVIALLLGVPMYVAGLLPRSRTILFLTVVLLAWVVVGYNGFGQVVSLQPGNAAQIPISFWAYSDLRNIPESALRDIQAAGGRIYLDAGPGPFEGERGQTLAAELQRLADYNIQVYLAPPASNFLSAPVQREWVASAQDTAAFIRRAGLTNVRGLIGDAELPLNGTLDILGADQANFAKAVSGLRDGIATLHNQYAGFEIGVTAISIQYLDGLDGDSDLSLLMRSPVDPPGGWDFINVMTYSSYYPPTWRGYYVYLVERAMARRYPARPISHLIGLVGGGFPHEPLLDFDDLVRDARLSRALGVSELVVFQLGALNVFGHDFVRRLTAAVNGPQDNSALVVPFSRPASAMLYGAVTADALLDARGLRGLLWLSWAILSAIIVQRLESPGK